MRLAKPCTSAPANCGPTSLRKSSCARSRYSCTLPSAESGNINDSARSIGITVCCDTRLRIPMCAIAGAARNIPTAKKPAPKSDNQNDVDDTSSSEPSAR